MKKLIITFLLLLFIVGCGKEKKDPNAPLTLNDVVENPDNYANELSEIPRITEIVGRIERVDIEEQSEEYKEAFRKTAKETGADKYIDVDANHYIIKLFDCDTPLTTNQELPLIVGKEYKLWISVTKWYSGEYSYYLNDIFE